MERNEKKEKRRRGRKILSMKENMARKRRKIERNGKELKKKIRE